MKKSFLIILLSIMTGTALAIPSYRDYSDGRRIYSIWTSDDYIFYFTADEGDIHYEVVLKRNGPDNEFCVDSLSRKDTQLPEPLKIGSTVAWRKGFIVFFDQSGEAYASWKEDAFTNSREDSLSLIRTALKHDELMNASFQPDVIHQGKPLIHAVVGTEHLLFELTAKSTIIYRAVRKNGKYVRGALLRRDQSEPLHLLRQPEELPCIHILKRYCPKDIYEPFVKQLVRMTKD